MLTCSVIVPCYRDEDRLSGLLVQLQQLPLMPSEIIVVDGANSPECQAVCARNHVFWLASEPCRGRQLLTGASVARGYVLWFLHADARLSSNPLSAIFQSVKQQAVGGYFRFRFDAPRSWPTFFLEPAIALRCCLGVPYGDQGLFMLRDIYTTAGGHAPLPLFEEVHLVQKVRQLGRFAALHEPILVNPRRWVHEGWWRRTWENRKLALKFALGVAPNKLAACYYSGNSSQVS